MAITLHYDPSKGGRSVRWALDELALPYERVHYDSAAGETMRPEYVAISPASKVPTLVNGEERYFGAPSILLHLAERYGVAAGLWPKPGTVEHADALSFTLWDLLDVMMDTRTFAVFGPSSLFPYARPMEERSKPIEDFVFASVAGFLDVVEKRLSARPWMVGESFSLCDLSMASSLVFLSRVTEALPSADHRHIRAWYARCTARPSFARSAEGGG